MRKLAPYAFIAPFFVLFGVFGLFPLLFSIWLSLHQWDAASGLAAMHWVGLENYRYAITDPWFASRWSTRCGSPWPRACRSTWWRCRWRSSST